MEALNPFDRGSQERVVASATRAEALQKRTRAMWTAGSYTEASRRLEPAAARLVEGSGVEVGHRVLDVGAGDGSVALAAARRGADVVATDPTPAMVERGRDRTKAEDAAVDWLAADAEALPFPASSFDRVLSGFGVMFAPTPRRAAAELFRVARPGGLVGVTVWDSASFMGALLKTVERHAPPPRGVSKPSGWGRYETRYRHFVTHAGEFHEDTGTLRLDFASAQDAWEELLDEPGPLAAAARALPPREGRAMLADEVQDLVRAHASAAEAPRAVLDAAYVVVTGFKGGH